MKKARRYILIALVCIVIISSFVAVFLIKLLVIFFGLLLEPVGFIAKRVYNISGKKIPV
jgi:hypothetical protein